MADRTVTFLFTDIEGSTRLWDESPATMGPALARHDALLREAARAHEGTVFKTVGDAFCVAFNDAASAVGAALEAQRTLAAEPWTTPRPIRVRMALHTGPAEARDSDYFGPTLNRVARLLAVGHGGQTLASGDAHASFHHVLPSGVEVVALGEHRLKDLAQSETVYGLLAPGLPYDFPPLRSLNNSNLPESVTSFVGRARELAEVANDLRTTRILTLTGTGGTGKTRLALQAAAEAIDDFPGGIWFVEFAALSDPALVAPTLASALGVSEEAGRPLVDRLAEHLRKAPTLLLLDNCEHLIDAVARLVETLGRAVPSLKVLTTSREPLGIGGETVRRVPTLSPPEAIRLFVERATAQRADFALTDSNAADLASLCRRLDGIPLAIELAAARTRALSVKEIEARLDDRFRLLTGGSRTALPRQQTLRALIEWSHDLLNDGERVVFRRLAAFAGGWTLDAAEAVGAGEGVESWEVLDLLASLVDRSLVSAEESDEGFRYGMLETLRHFAAERLRESGEETQTFERHVDCFAALAESAKEGREGRPGPETIRRLTADWDNMRVALDRGTPCQRLEMVSALWNFWAAKGAYAEGLARAVAALRDDDLPTADVVRFSALQCAGWFAMDTGDAPSALAYFREAVAIARSLDDSHRLSRVLSNLGAIYAQSGDRAGARGALAEAVAIRPNFAGLANLVPLLTDSGEYAEADRTVDRMEAMLRDDPAQDSLFFRLYAHERRAMVHLGMGRAPEAERETKIALDLAQRLEQAALVRSLGIFIGRCHRAQGRFAAAMEAARIALRETDLTEEYREDALLLLAGSALALGDVEVARAALCDYLAFAHSRLPHFAQGLEEAATTLTATGRTWEAAVVLGAADAERRRLPTPIPPGDAPERERLTERLRASMDGPAFDAAAAEGETLPPDAVKRFARTALAGS